MSLSVLATAGAQRVSDPHGFLWLLTISGGGLPEPIRLVNDTRNLVSNGNTFLALPFEVVPPKNTAKEVPRAQLRIDNIGRELLAQLETLPVGAELMGRFQIVYRATPDVIEHDFPSPLGAIRADAFVITASMGQTELMRRPATAIRFDPTTAPGLFPD